MTDVPIDRNTSARLYGKRIGVIGGTAGIGAAIARSASDAGAEVIIAGRRSDAAITSLRFEAVDITDEDGLARCCEGMGLLDYLVFTAASISAGAVRERAVASARASMDGKFWPQYVAAKHTEIRESLLLFSGTYSRRAPAGVAILAAVNAAIEGLGRALAVELAPVRVNVIAPGLVNGTAAYDRMPTDERAAMFAMAAAALPSGYVGGANDIANLALAVLANPYVNGTVVDIDGGALLV